MDTNPDPDRRCLDADLDPDPAEWCRSNRIRIHNTWPERFKLTGRCFNFVASSHLLHSGAFSSPISARMRSIWLPILTRHFLVWDTCKHFDTFTLFSSQTARIYCRSYIQYHNITVRMIPNLSRFFRPELKIRIRIKFGSWIRIRITVKSWIWIRISIQVRSFRV